MDGWSAFFFVLLMTVLFSAGTVGIFAAFHIIYQSRATPLERRLWGIRFARNITAQEGFHFRLDFD